MDDYDTIQNTISQESLLEEQRFAEQTQWTSDPVKRDMMFDDWTRKPAPKKGQSIWGIIIFLIGALLLFGTYYYMAPAQEAPTSSEIYEQEIMKQLGGDSASDGGTATMSKYEKMHQQLAEIQQQEEQRQAERTQFFIICAVAPVLFIGYVVYAYLRKDGDKPTARELAVVAIVTIVLAAVLYLVRMASVYLKFSADTKEQTVFLAIVAIVGAALLWGFGRRK